MRFAHWTAGVIFAFSLIVMLLFLSIDIVLYSDFSVYEEEYRKYDVLSELDMTMDDVMYVTEEVMTYLWGDTDVLSVVKDIEGKEQEFFNQQDRFHMEEVRALFAAGIRIRMGSCIVMAVCLIFLFITKANIIRIFARSYQAVLSVTVLFSAVIAVVSFIDFNKVFEIFHRIFFNNDLWLFDPAEDYMIRLFPEGFFADMAVRIVFVFAVSLAVIFILSMFLFKYKKKHNKEEIRKF